MKIGDDVALLAPYKTGSRALWHLHDIERPDILLNRRVGDKDDGPRRPLKHRDGRSFIDAQLDRSRCHRTRLPFRAVIDSPKWPAPFRSINRRTEHGCDKKQPEESDGVIHLRPVRQVHVFWHECRNPLGQSVARFREEERRLQTGW